MPPLDRSQYPTLGSFHYLNQASLGLIGQTAVNAMNDFLERIGRHGNTFMSDEEEMAFLSALRSRASRLFHCEEDQTAILSSASELLGQVPLILDLGGRSRILAVTTDFPAVTRPWLRLAGMGGCRVDFVDDDPESDLTDDLIGSVDSDTAVVAVGSVQYATGTVIDIPRLRTATAASGTRLVVDFTQEAGAREIPVGSWDADVAVTSGYKWLGGHGGVAIGVISRGLLDHPPAMPGWMAAADPFDFDATRLPLAADARKYTQSTISYVSAAGLAASIDQLLDTGPERIQRSTEDLARSMIGELQTHGWHPLRSIDDPSASAHIISMAKTEADIDETVRRLRADGVVVSGRGGGLRVSLAGYNDETDIEALAASLSHH